MASVDTTQLDPNAQINQVPGSQTMGYAPQTASGQGVSSVSGHQAAIPPVPSLSNYLDINAPQAQKMGEGIAQGLNTQYQGLTNQVGQAGQNFNTQVQAGVINPNGDLFKQIKMDPTAAAANPDTVKAVQGQLNAEYTGPTDFTSSNYYTDVSKNINDAVNSAANAKPTGGFSGLQSFLQRSNPNATAGESALDTALVSQTPGAIAPINQAAGKFSSLTDLLNQQVSNQAQGVKTAQDTTNATRTGAQNAVLHDIIPAFNQKIAGEVNTAQGKADAANKLYSDVAKDEQTGNANFAKLTPEQQAALGFSPEQAGLTKNLQNIISGDPKFAAQSLASFLNPSPNIGPVMAENVATPQDYATEKAYETLFGAVPGMNPAINQSTANEAGTFNIPDYSPVKVGDYLKQLGQQGWGKDNASVANILNNGMSQGDSTAYQNALNSIHRLQDPSKAYGQDLKSTLDLNHALELIGAANPPAGNPSPGPSIPLPSGANLPGHTSQSLKDFLNQGVV